ncbi:hypothetical protein F5J12DRAFT_209093 [Pisolithus orientalis]|uniref:uncharacterized protein n=1 Tax=Pisolithus orientalis TaxID=936130 RepID=UPI0022243F74|nr:uncharacterized protein F5J12DRAFT_209093 [Pisolithus orientalis]KAI6002659.1 hypothetical protein F5J12DRAFT_209093 [Pisolithus orientalis]
MLSDPRSQSLTLSCFLTIHKPFLSTFCGSLLRYSDLPGPRFLSWFASGDIQGESFFSTLSNTLEFCPSPASLSQDMLQQCHLSHVLHSAALGTSPGGSVPERVRTSSFGNDCSTFPSEHRQQILNWPHAQTLMTHAGINGAQDHARSASLSNGGTGNGRPFMHPAQTCPRDERGVEIRGTLEGCTNAFNSIGFSSEGERIASGSRDNTVVVTGHIPDLMNGGPSYVAQNPSVNCSITPYPTNRSGQDERLSSVPAVPPMPCTGDFPVIGTHEVVQMDVPRYDVETCLVDPRNYRDTPSYSFCQVADLSPPLSSPSNVFLPSSQGFYACVSNGDVSNTRSSGVDLATGTTLSMPATSFPYHTVSQPGCVHDHEMTCNEDGASGQNVYSAVPLSSPLNMARELHPPASDHSHNGGNLPMPLGSPIANSSAAVFSNSLLTTRPFCDHIARKSCGWKGDDGMVCGSPVTSHDLPNHFAAIHGIKNMASDIKVECRWCPPGSRKQVKRESMIRHLREVHLKCPRPKKGSM